MIHKPKNIQVDDNTYLNRFIINQNNMIDLLNKITKNNTVLSISYENNTLSIYTEKPININEYKTTLKINNTETMLPLINESTISLEELYEIHKRIIEKMQIEITQSLSQKNTFTNYLKFKINNNGIIIYYNKEEIATATETDIIFKDKKSLSYIINEIEKMGYKNIEFNSIFVFIKNQLSKIYQKYSYLNQNKIIESINSNLLVIITLEDIIINNKDYDPLSFDSINIVNNNKEKIVFNIHDLPPEIKNERYELIKEKKEIINMLSEKIEDDNNNQKVSLAEIINILSKIEEPISTYDICEVFNGNNIYLKIKTTNNSEKIITLFYDNLILTSFILKNNTLFFEDKYSNERYELMKKKNLLKKITFSTFNLSNILLNEISKEDIKEVLNNYQDNTDESLISINDLIKIIKNYTEEGIIKKENINNIIEEMKLSSSYKRITVYIINNKVLLYDIGKTSIRYFYITNEIYYNWGYPNEVTEEIQNIGIEEFNSKFLIEKPYKLLEALKEEKEKEKQKVNQKKRFSLFN